MAESKTPSLTVLGGQLAGTQCSLPEDGTFTIGSAPGSSLYLDLPGVSPYHARVVVEGGKVTVHDTGSSRTVHVNDNALDREGTELRNGDILWLGVPGEEDVVMMQCILPRRAPAPAPVRPPEPEPEPPAEAAEPTPDIETVALWAHERKAASSGHVEVEDPTAAEDSPADESGSTEDAPPPPDVVEAAPAHLPAFIDDFESETVGQAPAEPAPSPVDETYRIDTSETVNEVAPTLLMGSADEVEPGFVEPLPSEQEYAYQTFPVAAEPVVEATAEPEPPTPAAPPPAAPAPAAAKPAKPRTPAAPRPATTRPLPPSVSQRTRKAPSRPIEPAPDFDGAVAAPKARRPGPPMLAVGGTIGVLVLVVGGYFAWRAMSQSPAPPAPTPTPLARASALPPPPVATPEPAAATPAPVESATPAPVATPTPVVSSTPTPAAAATPTPRPTPTPRATPTPAVAAATPPPAASGPSPAQQAAALIGQAEAALGGRQYDVAIAQLDSVLRLDPGNAKATSLRADATQRRDLARRKFVAGRTVVDSEKTRKDKARGLVGFDADEKAPDFTGRIEFEMTPAGAVEANDAWTLKVFVVNQGQKAIKVQGVALGAAVNGSGGAAPVASSVREIAPQQRAQVAETSGTWKDGTTSWVAQATLTAPKNETLTNTLSWK